MGGFPMVALGWRLYVGGMIRRATNSDNVTPSQGARVGFDVLRVSLRVLCALWFRMEIIGSENVPATGAFIVSPVHRSYIDTPVIMAMSQRHVRFMGKESYWHHRPLAWLLSALGGIPLERGTAIRATLRIAERVLETGEPLVMFPEGTRRQGPIVEEIFDGPAYLASHQGVPIVPVGIGGSARAMHHGDHIVRPTKVVVIIGEPIWPENGNGDQIDGEDPGRTASRRMVRKLSATLRADLQDLFDEAQERAGTPNDASRAASGL